MIVTKIMNRIANKGSPHEGNALATLGRSAVARTELTPAGSESRVLALRPYRRPFNWWLFSISVLIPTLFAIVYFGFIAQPRYVSFAQLTVKSGSSSSSSSMSGLTGVAGMVAQSMSGSSTDSTGVEQYITSNQIVDQLQDKINLREIWSRPEADILSRLRKSSSAEDLHRYYNDRVTATYDSTTGLIDLEVEAYRAEDALKVASAIVDLSDKLVDAVVERERQDMVRFAETEVKRAHAELVRDEMAVQDFRTQHADFDPGAAASAVGTLTATLEQTLAAERAELASMRTRLAENSVPVTTLKAKIASLEGQLAHEQLRLTNPDGGKTYATEASEFERLQLEVSLAETIYSTDQQALVTAEQSAAQKHLYLEAYVAPNLPQACSVTTLVCDSIRPNRLFMISAFFVCGLIGWGVLSLLWAAVREHAKS